MKSKLLLAASVAVFSLLASSCADSKEDIAYERPDMEILTVMPKSLQFDRKGATRSFTIQSSADWELDCPGWLTPDMTSGKGSSMKVTVNVTAGKNDGELREGTIKVITEKNTAKVTVSQDGLIGLKGKTFLVLANSMVYYGGFVKYGSQGGEDIGMFYQMLKAYDMEGTVIDCTYGNHRLTDFLESGCNTKPHDETHPDHLAKVDLAKVDYVILSVEGSNPSSFLNTCRALYKRVTDLNPDAVKVYINHVYTVRGGHSNILDSLKPLHEEDGVIIVNCGQLAYDLYKGNVKVPGGSKVYSDTYTFTNHTSSDTHHPNPLMGYIMTQMTFCALSGEDPVNPDYLSLVKSCKYSSTGSLAYEDYYKKFYTTAATLPFMDVLEDAAEMKGIQQLMPQYINRY